MQKWCKMRAFSSIRKIRWLRTLPAAARLQDVKGISQFYALLYIIFRESG